MIFSDIAAGWSIQCCRIEFFYSRLLNMSHARTRIRARPYVRIKLNLCKIECVQSGLLMLDKTRYINKKNAQCALCKKLGIVSGTVYNLCLHYKAEMYVNLFKFS